VQKEVNPTSFAPAVRLFHRRWSVPVVSVLHAAGRPLRFNDLSHEISRASRDTLAETLAELQQAGVIVRESGDAAYRLTPVGERLGDACRGAVEAVTKEALVTIAIKKWPMLALAAIGRGAARFNEIKAALPGITSGALAPTLKDLETVGLIERAVTVGYPPSVGYTLTAEGWRLFPAMDAIVNAAATVADGLAPKPSGRRTDP
jgi:DNA-binding HxlR family transcriptional regulator